MALGDNLKILNEKAGILSNYLDPYVTIQSLINNDKIFSLEDNPELKNIMLNFSSELIDLGKESLTGQLTSQTASILTEEEKIYDANADGSLSLREKRKKATDDFKQKLNDQYLSKYNLSVNQLENLQNETSRSAAIRDFITNNPVYTNQSQSISLISGIVKTRINSGKELFKLISADNRVYIKGTILDSTNNEPLKGIRVEYIGPEDEKIDGWNATTNRKGEFILEATKPKKDKVNPLLPPISSEIGFSIDQQFLEESLQQPFESISPTSLSPVIIKGIFDISLPYDQEPNQPNSVTTATTGSNLTGPEEDTLPELENIIKPSLDGFQIYISDETGKQLSPLYYGNTNVAGTFNFNAEISYAPESSLPYISVRKNNIIYSTLEISYPEVSSGSLNTDPKTSENYIEITLEEYNNPLSPPSNGQEESSEILTTNTLSNNQPEYYVKINSPKYILNTVQYPDNRIIPFKGDGTIKEDLGVIFVTPITPDPRLEQIDGLIPKSSEIATVTSQQKDYKWHQQEKIAKLIKELKGTVIPMVKGMILSYGYTQAESLISKGTSKIDDVKSEIFCPTTPEGKAAAKLIIKRKNQLTKQLNNSLNTIDAINKALGLTASTIEVFNASYQVLKNIPVPTSTGVPGVPGLPVNVINNIEDTKISIDRTIQELRTINLSIVAILNILRQTLAEAIRYLKLLDNIIQFCTPDEEIEQEQIAAELTLLTLEESETNPIVIDVNGFTLSTETEKTPNPLKRRRAIATNKQGVVMLKGEWSFSAIDQILIDELVFYIQQNNLKAD